MICADSSAIAGRVDGANMPGCADMAANAQVPSRFAASTMAQTRIVARSVVRSRRVSIGISAVSVVSVNSCWRPRMTIRKPTE